MNLSQSAAGAAASAIGALLNGGTLTLYTGAMPASPETALAGDTALAAYTFAATGFGVPSYSSPFEAAAGMFVSTSATPMATGWAMFARATAAGGATVADFNVGMNYVSIASGTAVPLGMVAINTGTGNAYRCTTAGTTAGTVPTGTTTAADGTAVWTYLGPAAATATTAGAVDITLGNCQVLLGTSISPNYILDTTSR